MLTNLMFWLNLRELNVIAWFRRHHGPNLPWIASDPEVIFEPFKNNIKLAKR